MPPTTRRRPTRPQKPRWFVWLLLAVIGLAAKLYNDSAKTDTHTPPATGPGAITARATVSDGDSLRIGNLRLRLVDIDAAELHQCCKDRTGALLKCGEVSKAHLRQLIAGRDVACTWREIDANNRPLATCHIADMNLNARMVADGQAIAYRRRRANSWQPSTVYLSLETQARQAGKGVHAYSVFEPPQVFRANQRTGKQPLVTGC